MKLSARSKVFWGLLIGVLALVGLLATLLNEFARELRSIHS